MATTATGMQVKSLNQPDDTRATADKGKIETVSLDGVTIGRMGLDAGWRWSEHVKPIVGTESCQVPHVGYVLSGRLMVRMDDGSEHELTPGDAYTIAPGHDAWVVGDERYSALEFASAERYATPAH